MDVKVLRSNASRAAALLKSLANEDRLMLLCQLVEGEKAVSELEVLTGIRQPTLSQQLGALREAGVVTTRREAKQIFYRLSEEKAARLIEALYAIYCEPEQQP